jgi:hypothetical protein
MRLNLPYLAQVGAEWAQNLLRKRKQKKLHRKSNLFEAMSSLIVPIQQPPLEGGGNGN